MEWKEVRDVRDVSRGRYKSINIYIIPYIIFVMTMTGTYTYTYTYHLLGPLWYIGT